MTSSTSASVSIARAAHAGFSGATGCGPTRPCSRSSAPIFGGNPKCATRSPCRWPICRRPTVNANSPRLPGPAFTPGQDVTSSVMRLLGAMVVVMSATLQAQVNLKSSAIRATVVIRGGPAPHQRGVAAQRRRRLGPALLRGPRADRVRARGLRPPALPPPRAPPHRVHRLRPARRPHPRRDRRRARQAPRRPRALTRDWSKLSSGWSTRIDARIDELERLKMGLTECIGCGCLSLDRCPLSNPEDRAARHGPGPRYWLGDRPG